MAEIATRDVYADVDGVTRLVAAAGQQIPAGLRAHVPDDAVTDERPEAPPIDLGPTATAAGINPAEGKAARGARNKARRAPDGGKAEED